MLSLFIPNMSLDIAYEWKFICYVTCQNKGRTYKDTLAHHSFYIWSKRALIITPMFICFAQNMISGCQCSFPVVAKSRCMILFFTLKITVYKMTFVTTSY